MFSNHRVQDLIAWPMLILVWKIGNDIDVIDVRPDLWIKLSIWTSLPICDDTGACETDKERGTGTTQQASDVGFETRKMLRFATI